MGSNLHINVSFKDCTRPKTLEDVQELGRFFKRHRFHVAHLEPGAPEYVVVDNINAYVTQQWDTMLWHPDIGHSAGFWLEMQGMEDLICNFGYSIHPHHHSSVDIGGMVDFEFKDQRAYVEPFAQRLRELAMSLYPLLQPTYGYVGESGVWNIKKILKRRLEVINWVNIFGPPYVAKYGREFLLGLPGYRIEELPDGGIFHQLSPTFVAHDLKAARALHRQVVEYCARAGLKVTCKAPYQLPRVVPASSQQPQARPAAEEEPIPDESVRVYMEEMLHTTLLLKDGTRVKVVPVPWEALTPAQRQIALDAIKAAAIAEIREHRDKRIRFEFNAIPDELDQMLADLAGRDNPDFEWVEVEMGSR